MRRHRELLIASVVGLALTSAHAESGTGGGLLDGAFGKRKDPITVTADTLDYDYKANVVVYRGGVVATQGPVSLHSDTLTITLARSGGDGPGPQPTDADAISTGSLHLQEIVAVGSVRIDHGSRWATGGRATFDQTRRTIVLTEDPVLHDGANEVAGDRVVVYLDEDRSVVEGGRKRVKAVLFPGKDGGLAPNANDAAKAAATGSRAAAATP